VGSPKVPFRYDVVKELGRGGMGVVLLAHDRKLERDVALKVISAALKRSPKVLARFQREAQAQASLQHPNIVQLWDIDLEGARPYMSMEFIDGDPLDVVLRKLRCLPLDRVRRLAREVADALGAMHDMGLVHRDLKPGNLMVRGQDFSTVVMDLGLVWTQDATALTQTGAIVGTPRYIPPEVYRGGRWGPAADQYQLACILFECLVGRPLVNMAKIEDLLAVFALGEWPAWPVTQPSVPFEVQEAVMRGVAMDPDRRHPDIRELSAALALDERAEAEALAGNVLSFQTPGVGSPVRVGPAASPPGFEGLSRIRRFACLLAVLAGLSVGRASVRGPPAPPAAPIPSESALSEVGRLGPDRGLVLRARRPCRVHWAAAPGVRFLLEPGSAAIPIPPQARGGTLVIEEGMRQSSQEVRFEEVAARTLDDLQTRVGDMDPREILLGIRDVPSGRSSPLAQEYRPWRGVREWIPDLLSSSLSAARRRALLSLWQRWRRAPDQEGQIWDGAPDLTLPRGAAGSLSRGLPDWPAAEVRDLPTISVPPKPGRSKGKGIMLGRRGTGLGSPSHRADLQWPPDAPTSGKLVALSLQVKLGGNLAKDAGQFVISPRGEAPGPGSLSLWLVEGVEQRTWFSLYLPADLCPAPGEELQVMFFPMLHEASHY
jgi:predicted Ser/Thr protein kinase